MWWMNLQSQEAMDVPPGLYPERHGEPDCAYYMKTGLCAFGMDCRFNHPPDRRLAPGVDRSRGEFPERIGQPECQYYLKTGTCKFGATCRYHHPRERAGSSGSAPQLNAFNFPLRPGERDCAYYMRTGTCKYATTCKFNHPQPTSGVHGTMGSMPSSPLFPGAGRSGPSSAPQAPAYNHPAGFPTWPMGARAPLIPSHRPSSFAPMVLPAPQSVMPIPGWNTYQGPAPFLPLDIAQQQAAFQAATYVYGAPPQQDPLAFGFHAAAFSPYMTGSAAMAFPTPPSPSTSGPREASYYPERPGQPDCHYYMKTGECKFGISCRYHHPRDRINAIPGFVLGPTGLPLRPGAPPCTFYGRHGFCKFGSTCKFDHPFPPLLPYSLSASSLADMPYSTASSQPTSRAQPSQRQLISSRPRLEEPDVASAIMGGISREDVSMESSDPVTLPVGTSHPS